MFRHKYNFAIVILSILFLSFISSKGVFAEDFYMSMSVDSEISLDVPANNERANIIRNDIDVIYTCPAGYDMYISGPYDTNLYKDGNNNSESMIRSSSTFPTPIVGDSYYGTWGFTTEELNNGETVTTRSDFIGLSNEMFNIFSSEKASGDGTGDPETGKDTISVYYGASVDTLITSGQYKMAESSTGAKDNVITYTLTPNIGCVTYTVVFNPASIVDGQLVYGTGTMEPQVIYENILTPLSSNNYIAPEGYQFNGWNTAQDGTGIHYSDGFEVINLTSVLNSITLYAEWIKDGAITLEDAFEDFGLEKYNGYYKMQDMKPALCEAATIESEQLQLIDIRDDKLYWVARLKDGQCWMTQNLDLNLDSTVSLTHEDTDLGWGSFDPDATWTSPNDTYKDDTWKSLTSPESYDPGEIIWDGIVDDYVSLDDMPQGSDTHYSIGNFYNWAAATAQDDSSIGYQDGDDVNQSICPAGWMLPKFFPATNPTPGSFYQLVNSYGWGSTTQSISNPAIWESPLYYTLGGYWLGDSFEVGHEAWYWSSVAYADKQAYFMDINALNSQNVIIDAHEFGDVGSFIRCVVRNNE